MATDDGEGLSAQQLLDVVRGLPEWPPLFRAEWESEDASARRETSGYRSERHHLTAWLSEYDTPGYYGRQTPGRDARFFYQHFNDYLGLAWLAEALGVETSLVMQGYDAAKKAGSNKTSQSGAFRRVVTWEDVEVLAERRLNIQEERKRRSLLRGRRPAR